MKENNTLKKLNLRECGLQPEGLEEVIKGVQVNTKLETLMLSENTIDHLVTMEIQWYFACLKCLEPSN